jgi:Carbohydrate-binding module 48 (Isoamylase N-terminal domain)
VTDHETDPMVQRAVDELRRLPALDHAAVRRITAAAATARLTPADDPVAMGSRPRVRMWTTLGLAAAAAIVGFVARDLIPPGPDAAVESPRTPVPVVAPIRPASSSSADVALVPQQFVLENTTARRVSVVGDFNNWNPNATPMTRSSDGGLWSVILRIVPGRHVYGYMVNDSIFTLDPRKPKARDADFGTDASVLMVGRP